ncbi:MAG: GAF domain-containing protein [Pseudomonadota bacterium]
MRSKRTSFTLAHTHAMAKSIGQSDIEAALRPLTLCAYEALGDPDAAARPGALKDGERDYRVAGVFLITPDRRYNMLIANHGFPAEQKRLAIPIDWNHPGEVVRTRTSILLENTDEHRAFRQFLKTSRMGSSIYAPILTGSAMIGQIVAAAQARWTYNATDLARLERLAMSAARLWQSMKGADWLAQAYPAADLWRAETHV